MAGSIRAGISKQGPLGCKQEVSTNNGCHPLMAPPYDELNKPAITPIGGERSLTMGEIAMAKSIFKDSIDYRQVRVHNEEYLIFGLQDDNTAMTPNGEMYFNSYKFRPDFSKESMGDQLWFMHEMVHVWQYQLGYSVKSHGFIAAMTGNYSSHEFYESDPKADANKTLPDFNFEQQGDLIRDYYAAKFFGFDPDGKIDFLETVLAKFLKNPKDETLLPN